MIGKGLGVMVVQKSLFFLPLEWHEVWMEMIVVVGSDTDYYYHYYHYYYYYYYYYYLAGLE